MPWIITSGMDVPSFAEIFAITMCGPSLSNVLSTSVKGLNQDEVSASGLAFLTI
jgi:hypothetical protein